jgi:hypothetical protein
MRARAFIFKTDCPRRIDCSIDFFGGAGSVLAGLAVGGCAALAKVSDQGGVVGRVVAPSAASAEPARSAEKAEPAYTNRGRDRFFSLAWRAENVRNGINVAGLLENRDGPEVMDVTLRIVLWPAAAADETPLIDRLVTLRGLLAKKDVRSFGVTVPVASPPRAVSVSVYAYQFPPTGGSR